MTTPMNQESIDELRDQVRKFRIQKIEPIVEVDEEERRFRMEIFHEMGTLGLTGITTSEEYDGTNLGLNCLCTVIEELAMSSASYAVTVSVSSMVQSIINEFGSNAQKKQYLPALAKGEEIGAFALSETGSGSDAAALKCKAVLKGNQYILNGQKMWITSAGIAKTYIVFARTGDNTSKGISAFIVRDGTDGLSFGKNEKKMGWKSSPTRELILRDCVIPKENLLGQEGKGFNIAMTALNRGRITIASLANGLAKRAFEESTRYSLERQQFEQKIFEFQGIQFMLADMATELECALELTNKAALDFDRGGKNIMLASMAKLKATDTAMRVTTDAVQIHGGVGYTSEFPVERTMRDAKVTQILEGSNQIQRVVIARELKKKYS
jgi:butyryl-CoA dehydrogenase